jgi:hypothetical protein
MCPQHALQQLAGRTNEGDTLLDLGDARALANNGDAGALATPAATGAGMKWAPFAIVFLLILRRNGARQFHDRHNEFPPLAAFAARSLFPDVECLAEHLPETTGNDYSDTAPLADLPAPA